MDFDKAFMLIEQDLIRVVEQAETLGFRFTADGVPIAHNKLTGQWEIYDEDGNFDADTDERACMLDLPTRIVAMDLAEHMGLDSETMTELELGQIILRAIEHLKGADLPL